MVIYGRFKRRSFRRFRYKRRFRRFIRGRFKTTRLLQRRRGLFRRRRIYPELKYNDNAEVSLNTLTGSFASVPVLCFNQIPGGDGPTQRDGAKVNIKSWSLRFSLRPDSTNDTQTAVRIVGFVCRDMNGAMPAMGDILVDVDDPQSYFDLNTSKMSGITVLFDKMINLQKPSLKFGYKMWNYFKRLNMISTYSGTGSAITDVAINGLCLLSFGTATVDPPVLTVNSRVRWTDV